MTPCMSSRPALACEVYTSRKIPSCPDAFMIACLATRSSAALFMAREKSVIAC